MKITDLVKHKDYVQWLEKFVCDVIHDAELKFEEVTIYDIELDRRIFFHADGNEYFIRTWKYEPILFDSKGNPCAELVEYGLKQIFDSKDGGYIENISAGVLEIRWTNNQQVTATTKLLSVMYDTHDITFLHIQMKKRAKVEVRCERDGQQYHIHTYRFNNVPLYQNQYLSWENLNCCNGWLFDDEYLYDAVQLHKKLVSDITIFFDSEELSCAEIWKNSFSYDEKEIDMLFYTDEVTAFSAHYNDCVRCYRCNALIIRKGCLRDFFDMNEILGVYKLHDVVLSAKELKRLELLCNTPLVNLYAKDAVEKYGFDFANVYNAPDCIVNGLALGYPIESTVSYMKGNVL